MDAFLNKLKKPKNIHHHHDNNDDVHDDGDNKMHKKVSVIPWVEKYRPSKIDDIVYQNEVTAVLKKCLTSGADIPNLLFYGPPGTGKTSTIIALTRQLFGDLYKTRVLELNASDERGINVIREKVKSFSQFAASARTSGSKTVPPLKMIILDECDSMTTHAQSALRRTMEKESKTTRFCLICNYVSRIIGPIASRCSIFRFKPLKEDLVINKLREISTIEDVTIDNDVLKELVILSEGDLRKGITLLQSAFSLKGDDSVTIDDIREIAGFVPNQTVKMFIAICCKSYSYEKLASFTSDIVSEGFSARQLMIQLHDWVINADESVLTDGQKSLISEHIALTDQRLLDGADEYLQILDTGRLIMQIVDSKA